jgi:hypothetical protein
LGATFRVVCMVVLGLVSAYALFLLVFPMPKGGVTGPERNCIALRDGWTHEPARLTQAEAREVEARLWGRILNAPGDRPVGTTEAEAKFARWEAWNNGADATGRGVCGKDVRDWLRLGGVLLPIATLGWIGLIYSDRRSRRTHELRAAPVAPHSSAHD